jgi:hypothetical protein
MGSAIGQYSCTNLLKELEAADSESVEENLMLVDGDDELVKNPNSWIEGIEMKSGLPVLPDDPFEIPNLPAKDELKQAQVRGKVEPSLRADETKKKWGLVLIEKRPSRVPRDGRTIMEKAQDRKKKANLDDIQGISKPINQFYVLSTSEISNVAARIGISLGSSVADKMRSLDNIQCMDNVRVEKFSKDCVKCQECDPKDTKNSDVVIDRDAQGDVAPCTPIQQIVDNPVGGSPESQGQWTLVVKRRKGKTKVYP